MQYYIYTFLKFSPFFSLRSFSIYSLFYLRQFSTFGYFLHLVILRSVILCSLILPSVILHLRLYTFGHSTFGLLVTVMDSHLLPLSETYRYQNKGYSETRGRQGTCRLHSKTTRNRLRGVTDQWPETMTACCRLQGVVKFLWLLRLKTTCRLSFWISEYSLARWVSPLKRIWAGAPRERHIYFVASLYDDF